MKFSVRIKPVYFSLFQVDTHIHASSCMNQKHLLRFIKKTMKTNPQDKVCRDKEGREMSLAEVRVYSHVPLVSFTQA